MNDTTLPVTPLEKFKSFRLLSVLTFIVFPVFFLPLHDYIVADPNNFQSICMLMFTLTLVSWYLFDSAITQCRHFLYGLLIIFLPIIGVPLYIYKSRKENKRDMWKCMGMAVGLAVAQSILVVVTVPLSVLEKVNPLIQHFVK